MNAPYFSVIVPVYNVEQYLTKCIDSIIGQTFQDFELILVDDGSKDSSGEICDAYAKQDSRVQVIHKPNGGVVSTRKTGLQQSCGRYIVNVDSDDYLATDYLAHFYEIIQKTGASIIASRLVYVTETGQQVNIIKHALTESMYTGEQLVNIYSKLMYDFDAPFHNVGCIHWNLCGKVVERDLAKAVQLNVPDAIKNGEDCAVIMPAVCRTASLYISDYCGYHYRQVESSMVHTFSPKEAESLQALLDHLCGLDLPIPSENITAFAAKILWSQSVKTARAMGCGADLYWHMEQNYNQVISFVVQRMKTEKMTMGIYLRILPIRFKLWRLLWLLYHKRG